MGIKRRSKVDTAFSLASMSDIVFLLLIFFLITSTMINPNGLLVSLPKSSNQPSQKTFTAVTITKEKKIAIDQDYINPENLEILLVEKMKGKTEPAISIHADKEVTIEDLVTVMDIATRNKWKVVLKTQP